MSLAAGILIAGWIAYALIRAGDRPGLFGGAMLSTYGFSAFLGGVGGPVGLIGLLLALAELAKRHDRPPLAAELALLAWTALSLMSVFQARDIANALQGAQFLIAFAGSAYLYGRAFGDREGFWQDLALGGGLSLVLCEPGLLTAHGGFRARLSGTLSPVGASLLVDAPLVGCLTVLMLDRTVSWRRFALVAAVLFAVVLPIALSFGTRGTFVGAGAALALALLARLRAPRGGRFLLQFSGATAAVVLAAVGAVIVLLAHRAYWFLMAAGRAFNFAASAGHYDSSAHERMDLWRQAWALTEEAPLFGHGLFSFLGLAANTQGDPAPHNMFLEILVSNGFVGLALFLLALLPIARAGLKRLFAVPLDAGTAFAVCLLADMLVRHQLSATLLAGRSLFLAMGIIVARCYPAPAAAKAGAWRTPPAHDMVPR
jgi:O-antigen ligase/polysaccharide polymerase Wzy-like membrane protein